jgi:predicted transposase/invertase (TIGR01784 family)
LSIADLPKEVSADDMRLLWLALFRADTEEEQAKIELMEVPIMEEAIRAYHQITADSEFREMERLREMARHNEASALRHARDEAKAETTLEIARKMKNAGRPLNEITEFTGLSAESIVKM